MKLTILLFIVGLMQVSASVYSQATKFNFRAENKQIVEVLKEIEETSDFRFFYIREQVNVERKVSVKIKNATVEEILEELFKNEGINYRVMEDNLVLLSPENISSAEAKLLLQQQSISGKVTDEASEPLPGVTVLIKGTTHGTVTNFDGEYTITNVPDGASLQFSFVGMVSQEVIVGSNAEFNIILLPDAIGIEEVVAIGYGTQKKESITGAISKMKSEVVENIPVPNLSKSLSGRISGVTVSQASGAPGYEEDIRIRSTNTWKDSGNEPLYVIDGIVSDKRGFNALDYTEVDNITVLKDAASGAIYGARAANGVILVTTKTGKAGKFQLNYNFSYSFDKPSNIPEYVDAKDMVRLENYADDQLGATHSYDDDEVAYFTNNDPARAWYDLAYQDPVLQKHALTASGGTEKVKYFLAGSYFDQSAFIKNADYKKYNIRSNINVNFTENLSGVFNISYSQGKKTRFVMQEDNDGFGVQSDFGGLWGRLLYYLPTHKPKTDDGKLINVGWIGNPLGFIEEGGTNTWIERNINSLFSLKYEVPFLEGLSLNGTFGQTYAATSNKMFETKVTLYNTEKLGSNGKIPTDNITGTTQSSYPNKERLVKEQVTNSYYQLNFSANYVKQFDKHSVDALFVYEQSEGSYDRFYGAREGFPLLQRDQFWATSSSREDSYVNGDESETGRSSYIGRVSYNFDEKYFLNATVRRDGSMLFAPDYRWGTFPSVSAGWVMSKEDFFNSGTINFLKLRASYGLAGNDAVGGWKWSESFGVSGDYLFGTSPEARVRYNGIVNEKLTWEKTREINFGIDSRIFNSVVFNAEYYMRHNYDILDSRIVSVPASFGGNMPPVNYGIVDAKGFELELGYTGNVGEVNYGINGNFSYQTNKVILRDVAENVRALDDPNGRPTDYIRMLVATDIIRTQADLDALPDGYTIYGFPAKLGAINYEDVSGVEEGVPDGKIDDFDRQVLKGKHSNNPYTFGLNLNADWKGFGVDVFLQGVTGISKLYNDGYGRRYHTGARSPVAWLDSWSEDNTDASHPRPVKWDQSRDHVASTFWLKNSSYLRLQHVNLTYSLSESICNKINMSGVTFSLTGTNLLTLSKFKEHDPSVNNMRSYPTMKTYSMGINVKF